MASEVEDNQPRYTTKRLRDEIAKARAYARREALEEAAKQATTCIDPANRCKCSSPYEIAAAIRALIPEKKEG